MTYMTEMYRTSNLVQNILRFKYHVLIARYVRHRSLVNYCYDLRFTRPPKATIAKRVKAIAKMEGMDVDDNATEMLVEANGNDIRQVRFHSLGALLRVTNDSTL